MKKTVLFALITLIVGLVVGFFVGRMLLEKQWSQPYTQVSPATERTNVGANPSPKAGSKVLKAMPIGRSRAALQPVVEKDAVRSHVAAVGAGDEGVELHVVVENHGACKVTSLAGIAYGFDAFGKPAAVLKGGENYVAFESKDAIDPGAKKMVALPLKDAEDATLAIAQIDRTTCADGTSWARQ